MASSDDDEELRRAIALSLQETSAAASSDGTDYDRDLRLAMALSLEGADGGAKNDTKAPEPSYANATASKTKATTRNPAEIATSSTSTSTPTPTPKPAFPLDRKAMELERLARLGKRKRPVSPDVPSKQQLTTHPSSTPTPFALQFPHGAIKRTYAYQHPRTSDITISEVLQPNTLTIAVLSSFQWDNEWLFHHADPRVIKQIWIMGARDDDLRTRIRADIAAMNLPGLKAHFPPMKQQGCMHSKVMLLFHASHLRVVVPTANLVKVEWGETGQVPEVEGTWQAGVLENTIFLIDLPRREDGEKKEVGELETGFGRELVRFLEAQEVGRNVIEGLHKFDFSATKRMAFVHSIQGSHPASTLPTHPTGLYSLSSAIRSLSLHNPQTLHLTYATSSLGTLRPAFLHRLYLASSGLPPHPLPPSSPSLLPTSPSLSNLEILFPTRASILSSTGGPPCAGIITLDKKYAEAKDFSISSIRAHESTRPGLLSHNKLLFARGVRPDGSPFAWVYVGSANATEAAWGAQTRLKNGGLGVMRVGNWEAGVVVEVPRERLMMVGVGKGEVPGWEVFEGTVEVPFRVPGKRVERGELWFWREEDEGEGGGR